MCCPDPTLSRAVGRCPQHTRVPVQHSVRPHTHTPHSPQTSPPSSRACAHAEGHWAQKDQGDVSEEGRLAFRPPISVSHSLVLTERLKITCRIAAQSTAMKDVYCIWITLKCLLLAGASKWHYPEGRALSRVPTRAAVSSLVQTQTVLGKWQFN